MAERKRYIEVQAPITGSSFRVLGTLQNLPKKTIRIDMSRKLRGKGLIATFRIFDRDDALVAIPSKLELSKSYIRKMMRKRVDYVEDSFTAKCSDIRAVIKPFLITRKRVSRAVRKNLRNTAREFIVEYLKEKSFTEVTNDVLNTTLQKAMLPKLKKIYPLSFCEIRVITTGEIEKVNLDEAITKQTKEVEDVQDSKEEQENTQENAEEVVTEDKGGDDDSTNVSSD